MLFFWNIRFINKYWIKYSIVVVSYIVFFLYRSWYEQTVTYSLIFSKCDSNFNLNSKELLSIKDYGSINQPNKSKIKKALFSPHHIPFQTYIKSIKQIIKQMKWLKANWHFVLFNLPTILISTKIKTNLSNLYYNNWHGFFLVIIWEKFIYAHFTKSFLIRNINKMFP